MRTLGWLVVLASVGGGAYWARPDLFAFLQNRRAAPCKPIPGSALDPQPGLASFRCAPGVPGPGPDIEAGSVRGHYGVGAAPAQGRAPVSEPAPPASLRQLASERDQAFMAYMQAQRAGDFSAAAKHEAYMRAQLRLDSARRGLIASH